MTRFDALQEWIQQHFQALVLWMMAGGFALTAAELLLMQHTEDAQNIGVIATALGAVLAVAGVWARGRARGFLAVAFAVLALSGVFGMVEHLEEHEDEREGLRWQQNAQTWLSQQGTAFAEEEDEEHERKGKGEEPGAKGEEFGAKGEEHERRGEGHEGEHGPPPLAPLSVSGLAFLAALAVLAKKD